MIEFHLIYFMSLKMIMWKYYTQYSSKFGKLSSGHRTGKVSLHSNPKKGNAKECSYYSTIACISHTTKVMLKILQARFQQYVIREFPDAQAGFRKGGHLLDHRKSKRVPKKSISALLTMSKPLTVWTQSTVENSERGGNTNPPDLPLEKPVCRSGSNS